MGTNSGVNPRVARDAAHRDSVEITDQDLVNALVDKLGSKLVVFISGKGGTAVSRWKGGSRPVPEEVGTKLRLVYQIFTLLESRESDQTIRAWFIGINPQLDDVSPAEAVQEGRLKDAMIAARAF